MQTATKDRGKNELFDHVNAMVNAALKSTGSDLKTEYTDNFNGSGQAALHFDLGNNRNVTIMRSERNVRQHPLFGNIPAEHPLANVLDELSSHPLFGEMRDKTTEGTKLQTGFTVTIETPCKDCPAHKNVKTIFSDEPVVVAMLASDTAMALRASDAICEYAKEHKLGVFAEKEE